jgi:hypothetical protein
MYYVFMGDCFPLHATVKQTVVVRDALAIYYHIICPRRRGVEEAMNEVVTH